MANLLLTETCVRKCPYCFAKQYMEGVEDKSFISRDNFEYVIDFLEKSGISSVSLLGGEPLIHPQIAEIIEYLTNKRGFDICVFTSGIMPLNRFDHFVEVVKSTIPTANNKLRFVVNVNEPRLSTRKELEKVHSFLAAVGEYCSLSFNIYRLDYNLDFLSDYILRYGLLRHVRFGLANPIPGSGNQYIPPENFKGITTKLMAGLKRMYELKIHPGFDCGFPLCMFSDDDLGKLYKYTRNGLAFECGPTIDIGPDLKCWCCFPLSDLAKVSLKDFQHFDDLYAYFEKIQQKYRTEIRGIYKECDSCIYFNEMLCSGGCLAHTLNQFQGEGNIR